MDARAFVCALADGQAQGNERPSNASMGPTRGTMVSVANQRPGAFSKLVEEVCALAAFIGDEPLHIMWLIGGILVGSLGGVRSFEDDGCIDNSALYHGSVQDIRQST